MSAGYPRVVAKPKPGGGPAPRKTNRGLARQGRGAGGRGGGRGRAVAAGATGGNRRDERDNERGGDRAATVGHWLKPASWCSSAAMASVNMRLWAALRAAA